MKSKIYKLLITVALIAVCVFFLWPEEEENKNEDDWEYPVEAPRKDYDISLFKQLTNDEAAKLYDLKGTQVVFACDGEFDVCREMYKNVLAVQKEFNYTTN